VSLHDRTVDHVEAVARLRRKGVKDPFPNAAPGPPVEAIIGRRVRAVALGQISPRHPRAKHVEDRIQDRAIILAGALTARRHQRLQKRPFLVVQIKAHDPPPAKVNHDLP